MQKSTGFHVGILPDMLKKDAARILDLVFFQIKK